MIKANSERGAGFCSPRDNPSDSKTFFTSVNPSKQGLNDQHCVVVNVCDACDEPHRKRHDLRRMVFANTARP